MTLIDRRAFITMAGGSILYGGIEGDRVGMTCTCGAVINRNVDGD
jgi:hypothetical protein